MTASSPKNNSPLVPVAGLSIFALASGYLMSLIPLSLPSFGLSMELAPAIASLFYLGLLIGATCIEPVVAKIGHRISFIIFLMALLLTIVVMIAMPNAYSWLIARFFAGIAVAGVFVVVESWLLMADTAKQRAKRLGLYMASLYGGITLGQLAVGPVGTDGFMPYIFIIALLVLAMLPPLLIKSGQPTIQHNEKIKFRDLRYVSRPAMMGCFVSGLLIGPIYGLMPVYLQQLTNNASQTGILMASIILGAMLIQPLVSYLSTRVSKSLLMALFCLFGTAAVFGVINSQSNILIILSFLMLGACSFALYPIAITLACDGMSSTKIVSIAEVMLLSYSLGSVCGPLFADKFKQANGLPIYLGVCLITTCIYMLIKSASSARSGSAPVVH
ncbi:MFS transporter [Shewanella marina]|uniref:MFS transporter n=1 Tax=Shewanella marina TaxID=487319 RepID=UPI00055FC35F|nr:MFS transporter [Shewanella marina]